MKGEARTLALLAGLTSLAGLWVGNSVSSDDGGEPIICANGEPRRIHLEAGVEPPSAKDARAAQRGLPDGARPAFNEYTGEFEAVDAVTEAGTYGEVTLSEELVYRCDANNEPELVPLSAADPQAAAREHRQMADQLRHTGALTGLGEDPAYGPSR